MLYMDERSGGAKSIASREIARVKAALEPVDALAAATVFLERQVLELFPVGEKGFSTCGHLKRSSGCLEQSSLNPLATDPKVCQQTVKSGTSP